MDERLVRYLKLIQLLLFSTVLLVIASCGQKGDLYLPEEINQTQKAEENKREKNKEI